MVLRTSARSARLGSRLWFSLLVVVVVWAAHDATYAVHRGVASLLGFPAHVSVWLPTEPFTVAAAGLLVAVAAVNLVVLARRTGRVRLEARGADYRAEVGRLWIRLFPAVLLGFVAHENLEHLLGGEALIGLAALYAPHYPLGLPVVATMALVAAALGALVRWRIAVLEAAIAAERGRPARTRLPSRPAADAWIAAALCAHAWILARQDAGRAPPPLRA